MTDLSKYKGHTPGPWIIEAPFGEYLSIVIGDRIEDWRFVAHVHTDLEKGVKTRVIGKAQMQANARAIADLPVILAYARELEARNAELTQAFAQATSTAGSAIEMYGNLTNEKEALEARNAELVEALEAIANGNGWHAVNLTKIARAALSRAKGEQA